MAGIIRERILIVLSFATIYIVWGSTYLASAFVIEQIQAYTSLFYRFTLAGLISLMILFLTRSDIRVSRIELKNSVIAGTIFLGLGTGGAIWSLNYLDSGFCALMISADPLLLVLMIWAYKKTRPAKQTMTGIVLGILGIYLLVSQDTIVADIHEFWALLALSSSMFAWSVGSIFVAEAKLPSNQLLNTSIQLITGGMVCLLFSFLVNEDPVVWSLIHMKTIYSLLFLIVFGSIAAFTAFNFLLKKVSTEKVVTNTYVNPIIAMILGAMFNNEIITNQSIVAAVIMLFGVFLINSRKAA